ncbi:adenylate cyclase [Pseudoalteromonas espejiana DSM 9414]|uniref:Adenylate/guanylate cyclase domain-containing protein n=1 Tax=Pseudoalteromonas espejiana TaxID=28107 RepID=A0A510XQ62_9GAMM|nr:adenylate cyclase [Pseudoalteromonas espejiana DSM 9414]GEK53163.1 adenylate/guanylate cyclase domain-containing protein [Pseudoalteromonas espejiana]
MFIGLAITLLIAAIELFSTGALAKLLNRVEGIIYDSRLLLTLPNTPRKIDETVIIIDIDEKTMLEQGRFPWSRAKMAELVTKLTNAGVIVIAFDIFFSEPEINPINQIQSRVPGLLSSYNLALDDIKQQVDADTTFAKALSNNDTVLGFLLNNDTYKQRNPLPDTSIVWPQSEQSNTQVTAFLGATVNIPLLQNSATGNGFINAHSENDGFIRKAALVNKVGDKLYPSLALEAARLYTLANSIETRASTQGSLTFFEGVKFHEHWIQTDEYGQIFIPYKGRAKSFQYYSATDVLTEKVAEQQLEGSVVFIGTSAIGLADLRATPVGLQYPGVEVHANIFEGLLHPEILPSQPNWSLGATLLIITLTGCLLSVLSFRKSARYIVLLSLGVAAFIVFINFYLWSVQKISLPLFTPLLLTALLAAYFVFIGSIAEMKHSRKIKSMFNQYVPPDHIDQLIRQGNQLNQQSVKRNMTVLFADIRGFTPLSEGMTANQLSDYLNQYLSATTEVIFAHNGTIDKYVGDMVMAFWNAPLEDSKHAQHGVEAAMAMVKGLDSINNAFAQQQLPPINIGIGLSTGDMNVGDMGSVYRKAYTVLGDAVNLGSRVESLTKFYGVAILVTEDTMLACPHITFRLIDKVQVVGKEKATELYEPINFTAELNESHLLEIKKSFTAMQHYNNKNWQQALALFEELSDTALLSDHIYHIFINRIKKTDLQTLAQDWNGAFIHKTK